jgi:hypothetical protein
MVDFFVLDRMMGYVGKVFMNSYKFLIFSILGKLSKIVLPLNSQRRSRETTLLYDAVYP